jgi:ABC-2 type transport system permease protein
MQTLSIIKRNIKFCVTSVTFFITIIAMPLIQVLILTMVTKNFPKLKVNGEITGLVQTVTLYKGVILTQQQYMISAIMVTFLLLAGTLIAEQIINDRQENTLMRIFTSPVSKGSLLFGYLASTALIILFQAVLIISFSRFAVGLDWGKSVAGIVMVTLAAVFVSTALAFMISAIFKSPKTAVGVSSMIIIAMSFLSGYFSGDPANTEGLAGIFQKFTLPYYIIGGYVRIMQNDSVGNIINILFVPIAAGIIMLALGGFFYRRENFYE